MGFHQKTSTLSCRVYKIEGSYPFKISFQSRRVEKSSFKTLPNFSTNTPKIQPVKVGFFSAWKSVLARFWQCYNVGYRSKYSGSRYFSFSIPLIFYFCKERFCIEDLSNNGMSFDVSFVTKNIFIQVVRYDKHSCNKLNLPKIVVSGR